LAPPPIKERQGTLGTVTPRKESSKKKNVKSKAPSVESLEDCDVGLQAISKYEERLSKFEEMIRQMKADLYGSIETIVEKVTRFVVAADLPKRGVPRIVRNIQLVPLGSSTDYVS